MILLNGVLQSAVSLKMDTKVNKKILAMEWLILIFSFIFGIIVIPAVLTLLLSSELKELKSFYEALFNKRHFFMPLLIVFSHIF